MTNKSLGLPENFADRLPELRQKTLKWQTVYHSGSKINSAATITFHQAVSDKSLGTIILIPGLATNNNFDPLMSSVSYWGLTHKYNIVTIDTFINDFLSEIKPEKIKFNTYEEFKTIIYQSLKFVQSYNPNSYHIAVGHCASSNGITGTFNDCVKQSLPIPVQSALLFAPFSKTPSETFENSVKRLLSSTLNDVKRTNDPVAKIKVKHLSFLAAMENFIKEEEAVSFEPDLMVQWNIPVTFVTGQLDKISPFDRINKYTEILNQKSSNFKHLYLKNKKHNFATLYTDTNAIIEIIRSQRPTTR